MNLRRRVKNRARKLKRRISAILLALRDPATPWYAKAVGMTVVAYAVSPLDIIPDFIPILGLIDDAILLPLGIILTVRLIPRPVFLKALRAVSKKNPVKAARFGWIGTAAIISIWLAAALIVVKLLVRL